MRRVLPPPRRLRPRRCLGDPRGHRCGLGHASPLPEGHDFTTVELHTNVFAGARAGDVLSAIGRPLHIGGRTHVWEVKVANGNRRATFFTCTQMVLEPRD